MQRSKMPDADGWWWHTENQWELETGLSRREQETARKKLRKEGILEERYRGIPRRKEYRLNIPVLLEKIEEYQDNVQKRHYCMAESAITACTDPPLLYGGIRQVPETKVETNLKKTTTTDDSELYANEIDEYVFYQMRYYGTRGGKVAKDPLAVERSIRVRLEKQKQLTPMDQKQLMQFRKRYQREQQDLIDSKEAIHEREKMKTEVISPDAHEFGLKNIRQIQAMLQSSKVQASSGQ